MEIASGLGTVWPLKVGGVRIKGVRFLYVQRIIDITARKQWGFCTGETEARRDSCPD